MHSRSLYLFATLATGIVLAAPLHAQTAPPPAKPLAFDTVSIRPADPNEQPRMFGVQPSMFRSMGMQTKITIDMAFLKQGYPARDIIQGAPAWVESDWYDIIGKFDEPTAQAFANMTITERQQNIKPLLQAMLADRFKLVYHTVPIEIPGFALVISKGGHKLTPIVEGEPAPDRAVPLPGGGKMVPFQRGQLPAVLHFFHATMADLVRQLGQGVPIIDQTGLAGQFNFDVPRTDQDNPSLDMNADAYTRAHFLDVTPLGLELKPIKVPVDKIVIDSIQKPTPN